MPIEPFKIEIPDSVLDDLRRGWSARGGPTSCRAWAGNTARTWTISRELVEYWKNDFDWRKQEALINSFSHFKAPVDGRQVHFIHEKGKGPNPLPLIITHGWPGTFFEMHKVIPMLSDPAAHGGDPADAFDVVAPSMPGYGFSDAAQERGLDVLAVGDVMAKLMTEQLGYDRYVAQGGDWGASVTARLGHSHSDHCIAIHTTSTTRPTPYMGPGSAPLTEAEQGLLRQREEWLAAEGGYSAHSRHQAADAGLWPQRLPCRAVRLDRGEVPYLERLRRRRGVQLHQGRAADPRLPSIGSPSPSTRPPACTTRRCASHGTSPRASVSTCRSASRCSPPKSAARPASGPSVPTM